MQVIMLFIGYAEEFVAFATTKVTKAFLLNNIV